MVRVSVSIHARTGRATGHRPARRDRDDVSIHARTGRATCRTTSASPCSPFQFTRARGARRLAFPPFRCSTMFQFTRARGARPRRSTPGSRARCFNSRAHGARDMIRDMALPPFSVSIHARTGRATLLGLCRSRSGLFQFTRARGARPRPEEGAGAGIVSIHARTGRATLCGRLLPRLEVFQFTRARGARLAPAAQEGGDRCFNSRAHGARDRVLAEQAIDKVAFQFTRARGARHRFRRAAHRHIGFNSRAHGARDSARRPGASTGLFQFTRARGARHVRQTRGARRVRFNSRAHGARDRESLTIRTR